MSRVVLDSVKGIAVAQANRAELPHVATLFRRAVCSLKRKWSCAEYASIILQRYIRHLGIYVGRYSRYRENRRSSQ